MNKERFLTFTDAIIAIVATIMVLEIHAPQEITLHALEELVVPLFAYLLSFLAILLTWYNHHQLYKEVKKISPRTYIYNVVWLFVMSLFPFATNWVGEHPDALVPEFIYILLVTLWTTAFQLMRRELLVDNKEIKDAQENDPLSGSLSASFLQFSGLVMIASLVIVWFWHPVGLVSMLVFLIGSVVQFFKNEGNR